MSRRMQAAGQRDAAARAMPERRVMRKVGGVFKSCSNCGSGHVYRSENPGQTQWTHWCWTCGSYDDRCWSPVKEVLEQRGEDREAVMADLRLLRKLDRLRVILTKEEVCS